MCCTRKRGHQVFPPHGCTFLPGKLAHGGGGKQLVHYCLHVPASMNYCTIEYKPLCNSYLWVHFYELWLFLQFSMWTKLVKIPSTYINFTILNLFFSHNLKLCLILFSETKPDPQCGWADWCCLRGPAQNMWWIHTVRIQTGVIHFFNVISQVNKAHLITMCFSFLNFDYIQRWGWWVCGNRCTKWDLRPGQKHGLYWWVLFSLSLEPNVMVLDISEMICCVPFQVITWTRRGWNRVCTVTRGTTSPTCFLNTCPCKMCGHS